MHEHDIYYELLQLATETRLLLYLLDEQITEGRNDNIDQGISDKLMTVVKLHHTMATKAGK